MKTFFKQVDRALIDFLMQIKPEPFRSAINEALPKQCEEWEIPREAGRSWSEAAREVHAEWWKARIARQGEIDKSIEVKAGFEYLYDRPRQSDPPKVLVANEMGTPVERQAEWKPIADE